MTEKTVKSIEKGQPLQTKSEFKMDTVPCILIVVALFATCTYCHKDIDVSILIQKLHALENSVDFQNARIKSIEKSNKELKHLMIEKTARIEYLEAIMLQQHKEAKQFVTEEVVSKENNYTNQTRKNPENTNIYEGKKDAYENVIDRQGRVLNIPSNTPSDAIGFYAIMSKQTDNPGEFHTLIFDMVLTDIGNGYNRHTGVFTAPVGGLHAFTWRLTGNEYHSAQLHVNNVVHGATFLHVSGVGEETVSGTSVVLLNTGDNVFIQTISYHPERIGSNSLRYSTFGGWLIK